ncbi:MAG: hypothetical protein HYX68_26145 [Planctomycetes bacterium]|nr:hypothetical protein [Planctomycetota bacterium]
MIATTAPENLGSPPREDSIIELSLMMSRRQFDTLERKSRAHGMSVAHFLRRLIQESLEQDEPVGCCN